MELSRSKQKLVARLRNRRMRDREGLVLVEGPRAAEEALLSGIEIRFAVVSSRWGGVVSAAAETAAGSGPAPEESSAEESLLHRFRDAGVAVEFVGEDTLDELADTESPQGVLVVCREPEATVDELLADHGARLLLLDGVQDPGNVGTLIRAARAFGITGVIALDGTADPWNPKSVRASVGASFHLPVARAGWDEVVDRLDEGGSRLLVADAGGVDVAGVPGDPPWALLVGGEADGPRPAARERADSIVAIPMPGKAESLNAGMAGSILLYALTIGGGKE